MIGALVELIPLRAVWRTIQSVCPSGPYVPEFSYAVCPLVCRKYSGCPGTSGTPVICDGEFVGATHPVSFPFSGGIVLPAGIPASHGLPLAFTLADTMFPRAA